MASPLKADDLTRVAAYLAAEEARKKGKKAPDPRRIFRNTSSGLETADVGEDSATIGRRPDSERAALQAEGYEWLPGDEYSAVVTNPQKPLYAPPGKLPFISNTPTHEAPPGYSNALPQRGDPGMGDAMAQAASAFRGPAPQMPAAPPPQAGTGSRKGASRRSSVDVRLTSSTGSTPQARPFQPLAQLAPEAAEQRLAGLPDGVAKVMRQRWGLQEAQDDANRRGLAVELASAFDQIGRGIGGSKYDPSAWDNQRAAARQPVIDHQARETEARAQSEEDRRAAEDERDAREAERAARLEMERFSYGEERDKASDQLQRDRMAQDAELARQRMQSEAADRQLRREDMRLRRTEGQEAKDERATLAREQRDKEFQQRSLQKLGEATAKAPFGEFQAALEGIDQLVPGIAYGHTPTEAPMSLGDRVARSIPFGAGEWAMSEDGAKYATAIANLRDLVARMRSGAVLNAGEERHYLSLLGDQALSDPRRAAEGINAVRTGIANKLRNAQAAYEGSGALDAYERTGATTYRAPIFSGTGRRIRVVGPAGESGTMDEGDDLPPGWRRIDGGA